MESSTIALIILICTIIMYLTEIIPLSITALLSCIAMGIFGCCSLETVFSGFSNNVTMMIIGMCIVGDTLFHTGAASFLGGKLIRIFGGSEKLFLMACIIITAFCSAFLSNSATVAMMLPIAASAISASGGKLTKKHTYMPIGFAAVAGGGLTLIGSTPQIIAQGMLIDAGLEGAGFFEYLITGIPKVLIMVVFFSTFGYKMLKKYCDFPEVPDIENKREEQDRYTKFTLKMFISIMILLGCVVGFITQVWNVGIVSMLGAALCIITRCVKVKEAFKHLDWNTIILVACALGFASCLSESGAGEVIANFIVDIVGTDVNHYIVLVIIAFLSSFLGNIVSASAATPILAPICLYLAPEIKMDARVLIIAVVVFSSVVYTTPTSTPPNSMPLVAGYRYRDYVKIGGLLNVMTVAILLLLYPLIYQI